MESATVLAQLKATIPMSKWSKDSRGRRDVMMTVALIDATYDGGILIFCMVGIVGICKEMVLRK